MTRTKYILKRVVGSWRLFWGFCPECNSVDERRHTCTVCNGHRGSDNEMLKTWKQKYKAKLTDLRVLYLTNKELGLN
jgi:hypothetical protein